MNDQLKDMTIVIAGTDKDDDGKEYAITRIFHYDLQWNVDEFIKAIEALKPMRANATEEIAPFIVEGREVTK